MSNGKSAYYVIVREGVMERNEGIEIPSKVKAKAEPGLYIN